MVTLTKHAIDRPGFTLRRATGTLEIFAKSSYQIKMKGKKALISEKGAPDTVPYMVNLALVIAL